MKYIFSLFVLLVGYIGLPANIADDYEDTDYALQIEEDVCHGDAWNPPYCGEKDKNIPSYKSISKEIQNSLGKDSKELMEKSKTFARKSVKEILKTSETPVKNFETLMNMSNAELKDLPNKAIKVYRASIKTTMKTLELFKLTALFLREALEDAASKLSGMIYVDKILEFSDGSQKDLYCRVKLGYEDSVEKDKYEELGLEAEREVRNLTSFSGKDLRDLYEVHSKNIKMIASRAGEIIVNAAKTNIKKINSTKTRNKKLLTFISSNVKKIDSFSQQVKAKCNQIALDKLGKLEHLINHTVKSIKRIAKAEIKLNHAIVFADIVEYGQDEPLEELAQVICKLQNTFVERSIKVFKDYIKGVNSLISDSIEKFEKVFRRN